MPNTKEKGKLIEVLSKHIPYGYGTLCLIAEELMAEGVTFATDNNVGDKAGYCSKCHGAVRTDELFVVINPNGKKVETLFNCCPNCGRQLPQPPKGE
jgi:hypothetical protein